MKYKYNHDHHLIPKVLLWKVQIVLSEHSNYVFVLNLNIKLVYKNLPGKINNCSDTITVEHTSLKHAHLPCCCVCWNWTEPACQTEASPSQNCPGQSLSVTLGWCLPIKKTFISFLHHPANQSTWESFCVCAKKKNVGLIC